jgi:putative glutamine amidotransferase
MKLIGIPGWVIDRYCFGITLPYANFVRRFGQIRILGPDEPYNKEIDLLILPGGADVNVTRYSQAPSFFTGSPNPILEHFDSYILPDYIANDTPIIGICRGLQTLNVHFGGTLEQHIFHWTSDSDDGTEIVHELKFEPGYGNYSKLVNGVNSRHHQCIDKLGEGLRLIATAKKEKIELNHPEIIEHESKDIFAVQWHPEDCASDRLTPTMISRFLNQPKNVRVI